MPHYFIGNVEFSVRSVDVLNIVKSQGEDRLFGPGLGYWGRPAAYRVLNVGVSGRTKIGVYSSDVSDRLSIPDDLILPHDEDSAVGDSFNPDRRITLEEAVALIRTGGTWG